MPNSGNCPPPLPTPQTRPLWQPGRILTSAANALEQNYRLQKLRRHNRKAHGWGVLCGLWVVPGADATHPWGVRICPGYAIGPYGDEIEVSQAVQVNIEDFLWQKPDAPAGIVVIQPVALVAIRYQDFTDDLTVKPNGACQCNDPEYLPDRIGDGYQAGVVWKVPRFGGPVDTSTSPTSTAPTPTPAPTTPLCRPDSAPCPPCPESPWVILAAIQLPQRGIPITADMIKNGIRSSV